MHINHNNLGPLDFLFILLAAVLAFDGSWAQGVTLGDSPVGQNLDLMILMSPFPLSIICDFVIVGFTLVIYANGCSNDQDFTDHFLSLCVHVSETG